MSADGELQDRLAKLPYRRSEGNLLFMVAALEHRFEQGLLHEKDDQLRLRTSLDQLDLDIQQNLRTIIETQIDHLGAEERRVLEAAIRPAGQATHSVL